jgi:hypothetical protein
MEVISGRIIQNTLSVATGIIRGACTLWWLLLHALRGGWRHAHKRQVEEAQNKK